NLGLQLLDLYLGVFNHYYFLNDDLNANNYFKKVRSLKKLFNEEELNRNFLLQAYIFKIKKLTLLNNQKEITSVISDFQDETIKYLLQEYAGMVNLSSKLVKSTS